jgi:hypothetical protein
MILKLKVSTDFLVTDHTVRYTELGALDFCKKAGIELVRTENRSQIVYDAYGDTGIEYLDSVYISGNIQVMSLKVKRVTVTLKNIAEDLINRNVIMSYEIVKER